MNSSGCRRLLAPAPRRPPELEQTSQCLTTKLTQAECEEAAKKSKVLSNSISVRTKMQLQFEPLGAQASRVEWICGMDFTWEKAGFHACATGVLGLIRRARQESGRFTVGRQSRCGSDLR